MVISEWNSAYLIASGSGERFVRQQNSRRFTSNFSGIQHRGLFYGFVHGIGDGAMCLKFGQYVRAVRDGLDRHLSALNQTYGDTIKAQPKRQLGGKGRSCLVKLRVREQGGLKF